MKILKILIFIITVFEIVIVVCLMNNHYSDAILTKLVKYLLEGFAALCIIVPLVAGASVEERQRNSR